MNLRLGVGAIFGLTAVAAGAYANHGVDGDDVNTVMLAVRCQQLHGIVMVILGLAYYMPLPSGLQVKFNLSAGFMTLGILLFSGVIYLKYFVGFLALGLLVPFGGIAIMIGWAVLIWASFTPRAKVLS